ncbi:hypothetical protein [Paramicrobacterium chengjingii]|uniref:hypothetical protein n=1 Tax=Paramicrobacterium chengjingii TaxID=2769067 RepID=UPI00141F43B0|nr:hypothetical protein [Microbacterium chengjingii]
MSDASSPDGPQQPFHPVAVPPPHPPSFTQSSSFGSATYPRAFTPVSTERVSGPYSPPAPGAVPYYGYDPKACRRQQFNGLGLASLIVGIVALLLLPILRLTPLAFIVASFIAFIGLVLGIVALCLKHRKKGTAIAGTVVSAVAVTVPMLVVIASLASYLARSS